MEINDFLGISLVGAFLSLVVEWGKAKFGTDSHVTRFLTVLLAAAAGGVYWYFRDTNVWQTMLGVLAASSTVYNFLLKGLKPVQE